MRVAGRLKGSVGGSKIERGLLTVEILMGRDHLESSGVEAFTAETSFIQLE